MKTLIFLFLATLTLNSYASNLDISNLSESEILAIGQASDSQIIELKKCLIYENGSLDDTSCINDILGDVHN